MVATAEGQGTRRKRFSPQLRTLEHGGCHDPALFIPLAPRETSGGRGPILKARIYPCQSLPTYQPRGPASAREVRYLVGKEEHQWPYWPPHHGFQPRPKLRPPRLKEAYADTAKGRIAGVWHRNRCPGGHGQQL